MNLRNENVFWLTHTTMMPFRVPQGVRMMSIIALGAGGNGGNGFSRATGTAGGGGGGGGTGAVLNLMVPGSLLPDTLYIKCGVGGAGTSAANGTAVMVAPDAAINGINCLVFAGAGANGGTGSATAVGTAGGAGQIATGTRMYGYLGMLTGTQGQAGAAGGAVAGGAGLAVTLGAVNTFNSAGAGGAGTTSANFNGGAITVTNSLILPSSLGGTAGGGRGQDGYKIEYPLTLLGGTGGGSNNTGVGGNGGNGTYSCGGGGGGAGTTGGIGGIGGNGLIIIELIY